MDRHTYLVRARELALRGEALPQTKLTADDVREIRRLAAARERARAAINERLSNAALAERFGVHVRTVERVLSWERVA
jgi:transcriptional regulator GlxA family with amidase domain